MNRTPESGPARSRLRHIEGRHNSLAKELRQAFAHAERTSDGYCAIDGLKIVEEAIRSGLRFRAIFFRQSAENLADRFLPQIGANVETVVLGDQLFDSTVPSESPQGVAAFVRIKEFSLDDVLERLQVGPLIVVFGLQDPGNLGTILRSAEAFGSAGIVLGEGTVSAINAKVIRASAGSIFRLPIVAAKSSDATQKLFSRLRESGVRLVATSSHKGAALHDAKLTDSFAVFIGNEGSGLPRSVLSQVDELVTIPHASSVESLNAGVAGSLILYEAARQRRQG
jgi:RNA methyltransferase, TrmH family